MRCRHGVGLGELEEVHRDARHFPGEVVQDRRSQRGAELQRRKIVPLQLGQPQSQCASGLAASRRATSGSSRSPRPWPPDVRCPRLRPTPRGRSYHYPQRPAWLTGLSRRATTSLDAGGEPVQQYLDRGVQPLGRSAAPTIVC